MTRLQVRRRLFRLCRVRWPALAALVAEFHANREAYIDLYDTTRRRAIQDYERERELDRVSRILRVSGKHDAPTRPIPAIVTKERIKL